ncbi:MAG: SpoIID/LytB domain-containing protein [Bacteroidales bacterium]
MKRRALLIILLLLASLGSYAQISIRIFARTRPSSVFFTAVRGHFILHDGAAGELKLLPGDIMAVTMFNNRVVYRTLSGTIGSADSLSFTPADAKSLFTLRAPGGNEPKKTLEGSLRIKPFPGSLQILNITTAEGCLPGVVRAEAGKFGPSDYFKAQAVVARTYIYRNINRHELDGYNMCDDIHCQVYPGVVTDSVIVNACRATAGKVITDRDSLLIEAAFHGNCGGLTASSADVWLAGYPYLVSVKDPWCSYSASSTWKKNISRQEWNSFLRSKGITPGTTGTLWPAHPAAGGRVASHSIQGRRVTAEEIRLRFALRSSWFTMTPAGDSITVSGRGYGHGVGLCQDGAKHMAEKQQPYYRIIGFYYPGTLILDIKNGRRPMRP